MHEPYGGALLQMPSTIFNEGRVVGFSAYEIYVRHALSEDPTTPPASELEWLSSTLASGSSMVLKISADATKSGHHVLNIPLPEDSNLAAANTIIGSLFLGDAEVDEDGWATKITSYGQLLTNNSSYPSPGDHSASTDEQPTSVNAPLPDTYQRRILNYVQIVDGIVIQPGTWSRNSVNNQPPHNDFSPNLSKVPYVKLYVSDTITTDFYVLLTGFTLRTVLAGVSGLNGSTDTDTNFHRNGGFLGPAVFPWANKIVFSVPSAYASYFLNNKYSRKMATNGNPSTKESVAKNVRRLPVVDMETTDPATYYETQDLETRVPLEVLNLNKVNGDAVLTVYQRNSAFPPALFGTKVSEDGDQYAHPLDVVAPGTVKLFDGDDREGLAAKSVNFEDKIPSNHALFRDTNDYVVRQIDHTISSDPTNWVDVPVADTYVDSMYGSLESSDITPSYFVVQTNYGDPVRFVSTSTLYNRRIRGKVSDQFRQDFGIDPATPEGFGFLELIMQSINNSDLGTSDSVINRSMFNYISAIPDWKSKYFFIVQSYTPTHSGSYVANLTLVPVEKPRAGDAVPSNTFDYIFKSYGPSCKIPIVLPTSTLESNRSGSFGQYVGGYYNGEGPTAHLTILDYLQSVVGINPVALMDYTRRVPQVDGYENWQDAYSDITIREFVTAVRDDAVEREIIPSTVTVNSILNGDFSYTYTDQYGASRTTTYQRIDPQYRDLTISQALEIARFYDLSTGQAIEGGSVSKTHYANIEDLTLVINGSNVKISDMWSDTPDWQDDEDLRFELTTSQPADWNTRWKHYYTRYVHASTQEVEYYKLTSSSAPTWAANTYYKLKYELSAINFSQSLTLTTSVQENSPKYVAVQWPSAEAQERYSFTDGPLSVTNVAGLHQTKSLSVADRDGKTYDMSGEAGVIADTKDGNIHWEDLLDALVNNKAIDILGSNRFAIEFLKTFGNVINGGIGISIVWDESSNKYIITNTQPYNPSGQGYTRLYQANAGEQEEETVKRHGGFEAVSYNGWRSCDNGHLKWWGDESYDSATESPYANTATSAWFNQHLNFTELAPGESVLRKPVPRIRIDILPAAHLTYRKIICAGPPLDWDTCWKYYYYERQVDGEITSYVDLATLYRRLLTSEPSDWSTNYFNYYTYDELTNKCSFVPVSSSAPTWQANTYYTSDKPEWLGDTFTAITSKPDDWDTYDWDNNTKYYLKVQTSPDRYAIVPRGFSHEWASDRYFTREDTAKYYVGYPDTTAVNFSGVSSYTPTALVSSSSSTTYSYALGLPPKLPYTGKPSAGSISHGFSRSESVGAVFKHAQPITSADGRRSVIAGIKFTGKYAYLNHTRDMITHSGVIVNGTVVPSPRLVYTFAGTTSGTSGIWNARRLHENHYLYPNLQIENLQSFDKYHDFDGTYDSEGSKDSWTGENVGAAWAATCNVYEGPANGFTESTFIVSAAAYSDGYNDQLYIWSAFPSEEEGLRNYIQGDDMTVYYTNLNISSLFYI